MDHFEIKANRLEIEQVELMNVIANMVDDVQILLRYVDCEEMDPDECTLILEHHLFAIKTMGNVLEGR